MSENTISEMPITQEELNGLIEAANANILEEKELLAQILDAEVSVLMLPRYDHGKPERLQRTESMKQLADVDLHIAELEQQFNNTQDAKIKEELEFLFQEQEQLGEKLEALPKQQNTQQKYGKRKLTKPEKLIRRLLFEMLKPDNAPLEKLRSMALDGAMMLREAEGKSHGAVAENIAAIGVMFMSPSALAQRITHANRLHQ